jgi:DNA-binding NtrC family response regulator
MVTTERVEAVIEQIRPLLRAEGADIEVLRVDPHAAQVRVTGLDCGELDARLTARPEAAAARSLSDLTPISLNDRLLEVERCLIRWALKASQGNKSRAAALLRVKRSTLGDRIRHCGLETAAARADAQVGETVPT